MFADTTTTNTQYDLKNHRLTLPAAKTLHVRPFNYTDGDYEAAVAIENAIHPEWPTSVAVWQHWDKNRRPEYLFKRYVAERKGEIVAAATYGHTFWAHRPDKYFIDIYVHPAQQRQGIGTVLYDFVRDRLARRNPAKLVSHTRADRTGAVRFLKRRGFSIIMRENMSRLESATFDAGRFADKIRRVQEAGIAIKTMAELSEEDPDWKRKVYDLEWDCLQDVPTPDPFTQRPFAHFEKSTLNSPTLLPDAWFIAVDGDRYVGLSVLWRNLATDKLLGTGLTGVVRSHRRMGIATALKVRAVQYAQAHGNAAIDTENEENNPMYQLNVQLGFKPQPQGLVFAKELR